mgnify:CR=1 FL=1
MGLRATDLAERKEMAGHGLTGRRDGSGREGRLVSEQRGDDHGVGSLLEKGEAREVREVERERSTGSKRREGRGVAT